MNWQIYIATVLIVASLVTIVLAFASYVLFRMRERRGPSPLGGGNRARDTASDRKGRFDV